MVNPPKLDPIIASLVMTLLAASLAMAAGLAEKAAGTVEPTTPPEMIYVADFALDSSDIKPDQGVLGGLSPPGGRLLGREGFLHGGHNPEMTAERLVNLLADALAQDLAGTPLPAMRWSPSQSRPHKGWLVQGQFLEVDEGNRLRRAVFGFGAGATEMHIEVTLTDLSRQNSKPFLTLGTFTGGEKSPGAAVTLNPYVAAAKFVLAKHATERDVRQAAAQIAGEIVKYGQAQGLMNPSKHY
jgi:hypothetical protein